MKNKILTDIKIPQCSVWQGKTDYLFQNAKKKGGTFRRFVQLLKQAKNYDVVVTADIKTAQIFGLFRYVFQWKKPRHIILELMLDESREDIRWKTKRLFQRICFSAADIIFVSSRREISSYAKRLKLSENRLRFLPFHTDIIVPKMIKGSGYILSAGRTGRDFVTLARAVKGLDVKVVVVSDQYHAAGIDFPPNMEVYCEIPYKQYLALLHSCSMVIVPLKKLVKSTGQVVFLEAMALGKPVIATDTVGTEDYLEDGVTGTLVPPEDSNALRAAIVRFIEKPHYYKSLADKAFIQIKEKHTFSVYTGHILHEAEKLISSDSRSIS